jgi:uncharacterized membrane protein YdfJ with MMPL/SSD domain
MPELSSRVQVNHVSHGLRSQHVLPVPAVRSLGIFLAILVTVNFLLAVTWLPVRD